MNQIRTKNNLLFSFLPYLVFLVGAFIYFAFFIDYVFFYQEKSSLFVFSSDFLIENLHQPGGLLIWLGKFFSTFYYCPIAGAIIISTILILTVLTISRIIGFINGKNAVIVPFIVGIALFFLQTDYRFLLFNNLGLLLQLVLFFLTIKYLGFLKGWVPVFVSPFWYFATGGFSWIFSILLTIYLAFSKEKMDWIKIIILWCLNLATFYLSKELLFFQTAKTLLIYPFSELTTQSHSALFISIAGIISILPVITRIKFTPAGKLRITPLVNGLIAASLISIILVSIGIKQFDKKNKQYFHVEKLFYQNKFDEIIAYNTANPPTNSLTIFLNNIALCETDQLNDLLFHFPQSTDGQTLFLKWDMVGEILKRGGYFYYTVGMINEAHRWAFENMIMKGHTPEGLKMLIKTELINGNYKVASKYISILSHAFFYKKEAIVYEKFLFNDAALNADRELGDKRQNKIKIDFFSITDDPYINIERILATDSLNRNAFEYKMAFRLLKKDYQHITAFLPQLESLGFKKIPVHIGEAAVVYNTLNKKPLPVLRRLSIDPQTETRWTQFLQTFQANGNNLQTAEPALRNKFKNTFWYYSFYR